MNKPNLWKWLILYWFSNDSETGSSNPEINFINNWYGVYQIYNRDYIKFKTLNWFQKFKLSYRWNGLRNPNWNLQTEFKPKEGEKTNIVELEFEGDNNIFTWRNKTTFGKQFVIWEIDGTKYFRYSYTRNLKQYSPNRLITRFISWIGNKTNLYSYKENEYVNFMAGTGNSRFILKYRTFK